MMSTVTFDTVVPENTLFKPCDIQTKAHNYYSSIANTQAYDYQSFKSNVNTADEMQGVQEAFTSDATVLKNNSEQDGLSVPPGYQCIDDTQCKCDTKNMLIRAMIIAYNHHLPLVLSPDDIWYQIMHAFTIHVNRNSTKLRDKIVNHADKMNLEVEFDIDNWDNFYVSESFINTIAELIDENTKDNLVDLVNPTFTTSTPITNICNKICLMDMVQSYFEYTFSGLCCGIPSVTLLGTLDDWQKIRTLVDKLANYGLEHWLDDIRYVADEFIKTYKGEPVDQFWGKIFTHVNQGSGGDRLCISGWVSNFFPYVGARSGQGFMSTYKLKRPWQHGKSDDYHKNHILGFRHEMHKSAIPHNISVAPVNLVNRNTQTIIGKLSITSGHLAIAQDIKTCAIRPILGWVAYKLRDTNIDYKEHKKQTKYEIKSKDIGSNW